MHLSLALLVSSSLLALEASAGLLPRSPTTSIQSNAQLQREIRRRQVTTADLKRRRNAPKRKRVDASPAVCAAVVGTNLLVNGDFETGSATPWTVTTTGSVSTSGVVPGRGYGGQGVRNYGYYFRAFGGPASTRVTQTVQLCAGTTYDVSFDLGTNVAEGTVCPVQVKLTGDGINEVLYSGYPCQGPGSDACPLSNGNAYTFLARSTTVGPYASASAAVFEYTVTCTTVQGQGSVYEAFDNARVSRSA